MGYLQLVSTILAGVLFSVAMGELPMPIDLGLAAPYVVLAGTSFTSTGVVGTIVNGDVGISPGTGFSGFPPGIINGATIINGASADAQGALTTAYNHAALLPFNETLSTLDLGGMILRSNVYRYDGAAEMNGILTLDANGDPDAVWVFQIASSLLVAEGSSILFKNDIGNPDYVYWQVGSSATIGASVPMIGNILAFASITVNNGASVDGRCLARNAAVTLDKNVLNIPTTTVNPADGPSSQPTTQPSAQPTSEPSAQPSSQPNVLPTARPSAQPVGHPTSHPNLHPTSQPSTQPSSNPSGPRERPYSYPEPVDLGYAEPYAVLAFSTVTSSGTVGTIVTGNIGLSPGTVITGFPPGILYGSSDAANVPAFDAKGSLTSAYILIAGLPSNETLSSQDLGGMVLTPKVYYFAGAAAMNGMLTLDALGNPDAVWVFQVDSSLLIAEGSSIIFKDSIGNPDYVYWQVGSSATIGLNVPMIGNILAFSSITVNDGASVIGRCLARNAAVTLDNNKITIPSAAVVTNATPTSQPSSSPSTQPSAQPTGEPSAQPSAQPSGKPSVKAIVHPTSKPSGQPSGHPSSQPASHPSAQPSSQPSGHPSSHPASHPSAQPSTQPSSHPSAPVIHPAGPGPIDLGLAAPYGVLGGSTVTSTGATIVNGDIGLYPGTVISGFPPGVLNGASNAANTAAVDAQASLETAYGVAVGLTVDTILSDMDLADMILFPGVYYFSGAAALNGMLTLDANGDSSAAWVFQIGSSLTISQGSTIVFKNSVGNADHVYWQVTSSATIGQDVPMIGNVLAFTSITVNAGATVAGRCLARNGAVSMDAILLTRPAIAVSPTSQPSTQPSALPSTQPSAQPSGKPSIKANPHPTSQPSTQPTSRPSVYVVAPVNPNALDLGLAAPYAILAGTTVTSTGTVGTVVNGNLGIFPGTARVGFPPAILNGVFDSGNTAAGNAQGDLTTAYNVLFAKAATATLTDSDLGGMTLLPGVYKFDGAAAMNGILTLDAAGDSNAVWTFQVGSTLLIAEGSSILFKDSIGNADYVYWQVGTTATIAINVPMVGNILALTSIVVNDGATVLGRCLARNAEVTLDRSVINMPTSSAQSTMVPSSQPSARPSGKPTVHVITPVNPTSQPSGHPTQQPISHPSAQPSSKPSVKVLTHVPTSQPSAQPSGKPSIKANPHPTSQPSTQPTSRPSVHVVAPVNPNALDLGLAAPYAILAGTTVTSTGTVGTVVNGNLGIFPGTARVGFPPAILNGVFDSGNTAAGNAQGDLTTAYNVLFAKAATATLTDSDLGGMTLLPGVYKFDGAAAMNGILTLDAAGDSNAVWTFQVGSTLLIAEGSSILFKDSIGNADYVYWQVGTTATIAINVPMVGNILALTSIVVNDGATVLGRCLARNAEVTLDRSVINMPTSSAQSTMVPSSQPSAQPSGKPTVHVITPVNPTSQPSGHPTQQPNSHPSAQPSSKPSVKVLTHVPTSQPSAQPSMHPTVHVNAVHPTSQPSSRPTDKPSSKANANPTSQPSSQPSRHPTAAVVPVIPFHDTPLDLGLAQPYVILAGTTVTSTGVIGTVVTGDIGIFPGSAITGFPPAVLNGAIDAANGAAGGAQGSLTTAYNVLAGKPFNTTLSNQDLGGMTLLPGVYKFDVAATMNGRLTLDANGDAAAIWTFQIGSSLLIAEGSSIIFKDSIGNPDYVYWQVGSSATLAKGVPMIGNILALASITVNAGASVNGRCLARNAAVTLDNNKITMPNVVSFSATQTVSGISMEQYNADPELNSATLKQAIADSMTGVLPSDIQNLEVTAGPTSAVASMSLRSAISKRALSTSSIVITYDVIVSSTMTTDQLRQQLTTAVETGVFNDNLHAAAAETGATSLDNATSNTITTEPIVTDDTNDTPVVTDSSDSSTLSGGAIAAIVIGVVFGIVLLAMICYIMYFLYAGAGSAIEEHRSNQVPTVDASEIELSEVESSHV